VVIATSSLGGGSSAGALQHGHDAASVDLSHLRMHCLWYSCLHGNVTITCDLYTQLTNHDTSPSIEAKPAPPRTQEGAAPCG
jgi:hypothetical protein